MDQCMLPIELFGIIAEADWRVWRGLVATCRALHGALRGRKEHMRRISKSVKITDLPNYKIVEYSYPNGVMTKSIWANNNDYMSIYRTEQPMYRPTRPPIREIVYYTCYGELNIVYWQTADAIIARYLRNVGYLIGEYNYDQSRPKDVGKNAIRAVLKDAGIAPFILDYLPEFDI